MKSFKELRIEMLENADQLDELSRKTLVSYDKKAGKQYDRDSDKYNNMSDVRNKKGDELRSRMKKRERGEKLLAKKYANEDTQIDELSQDTIKNYHAKAGADMQKRKASVQRHMDAKKITKGGSEKAAKDYSTYQKRTKGLNMAAKKMKEDAQLDELSSDTLGRYAKKAHRIADIGKSSGADAKSDKRVAGAKLAVKKLGAKAGAKGDATRTANNIQKSTDKAKAWRKDKSVDRNKEYSAAQKGINRLWDKAASKRG